MQYMNVCEQQPDEIDNILGCTRLTWAQEFDDDDVGKKHLDPSHRHFDVVDFGTIRGVVHIVRGDYGLSTSRKYKCEGDRHWSKVWFYLNRFKLEKERAKYFMREKL